MALPLCVLILVSVVCVGGDILLKMAVAGPDVNMLYFLQAAYIFAGSTFGWMFIFKNMKLTTVGVTYSVLQAILLTAAGVLWGNEPFGIREGAGLCFGLGSVLLLNK